MLPKQHWDYYSSYFDLHGWGEAVLRGAWLLVIAMTGSLYFEPAAAYEGKIHQQLTFIAARQFNDCARLNPTMQRFSALETRRIVRANVDQADAGLFNRMFRWNYYNRADRSSKRMMGVVDTRFHEHFERLVDDMRWAEDRRAGLKNLGRIINYIQDVSSPSRVVPVYTGRWWRFSMGDRFDRYRVRQDVVEEAVMGVCDDLPTAGVSFHDVLEDTANRTINAVRTPIYGYPVTWEVFWSFNADPDEFGEYGPAGNNFGDRTRFRCGEDERCLLLKNDPLYRDFADAQHITAVLATMRALALMQATGPVEEPVQAAVEPGN